MMLGLDAGARIGAPLSSNPANFSSRLQKKKDTEMHKKALSSTWKIYGSNCIQ